MGSVSSLGSSKCLMLPETHTIIRDGRRGKIIVSSTQGKIVACSYIPSDTYTDVSALDLSTHRMSASAASTSTATTRVSLRILRSKRREGKIPELYIPPSYARTQSLPIFYCAKKIDIAELHNMLSSYSGEACLCLRDVVINAWEMREKSVSGSLKFCDKAPFSPTDPRVLKVTEMQLKGEPILKLLESMSMETLVGFKKLIINYCSEHRYFEKTSPSTQ